MYRLPTFLLNVTISLLAILTAMVSSVEAKDKITISVTAAVASSPLFIAKERGYFEKENIDVTFRFFEASQPIMMSIASKDADFGVTAFTAGFYNLAGKGALQVIGAQAYEKRGFEGNAILVSNEAYGRGFDAVEKFPGHSFAMPSVGSSGHYMINQLAKAVGFDLKAVNLRSMQTLSNMVSAVRTGQIDSMIMLPHIAKPMIKSGQAKQIGWLSDYVSYQFGGLFTSRDHVEQRRELVERVVKAYQAGVADYRSAMLEPNKNPDATEQLVKLIHKYVYSDRPYAEAVEAIANGAMYIEEEGRLDVTNVHEQIAWYKSQGMVNEGVDPSTFINTSFIPALKAPN